MKQDNSYRVGIISMLSCDVLWGILPLYWQMLRPIDSWVIIFYRIFLVGLTSGIATVFIYGIKPIKEQLAIKSNMWKFPLAGLLITCNWSIYIWAVNADHVIQTCVGYYIEPLIVCLLGIIIFKDKVTKYKLTAMLFALAGMLVILFHFMEVPLIALTIATSFAIYAAVKKWFDLPPIMSVFMETMFLMVPALCVVIGIELTGHGALAVATPGKYLLLLCCGILTAAPLSFFASAATKIPLVTVGMLEYLSPSIALVLGIFVMKEPFDLIQFISFVIVWIGLAYFSYGELKTYRQMEQLRKGTEFTQNIELFSTFGESFDRFDFPGNIFRVTSGHGGESFLIAGSEKTALYDCGMAYCGDKTVRNIEITLSVLKEQGTIKRETLDYIILSHSHYDHIGGLPYIRDRYPDAVVCGSAKCQNILVRENARKLIKELGTEARDLYIPGSDMDIRTDNLSVDMVLADRDSISLGKESLTAYETKGHTDCSLSILLEPLNLLFTSESTGILEGEDYVHTPSLKSFKDSLESADKCEALKADYICLPHFGMLPKGFSDEYFRMFREEVKSKMDFVRSLKVEGLDYDQMLARYIERYWTPAKEMEQPKEAFEINSGHILKALIRAIDEDKLEV